MMLFDETNFYPSLKYTSNPMLVLMMRMLKCAPCDKMFPIFNRLSKEYEGRVIFGYMWKHDAPNIAPNLNIKTYPSFIIFSYQKQIAQTSGSMSETALNTFISQYESVMERYRYQS